MMAGLCTAQIVMTDHVAAAPFGSPKASTAGSLGTASAAKLASGSFGIMQRMLDRYTKPGEEFFRQPLICTGSPQAAYLVSRGIDSLQGVNGLRAASYSGHPAIIAVAQAKDQPTTVQYTVLDPAGKRRPYMKGHGPQGGAVRLIDNGLDHLFVSEGVENALSHWILTGKPTHASYWAALDCGNLAKLVLPIETTGCLTVLYDKDQNGRGLEAAQILAARAEGLGWKASLSGPPTVAFGDWNDELQLFNKD